VERTIPQWLEDFTPTVIVDGLPRVVRKRAHTDPRPHLPPQEDVDEIMRLTIYRSFTSGLEGGIFNPDETSLLTQTQMHNEVHGWEGGIMGNPRYSPTDVLFWLHHANCDRL
jgi:tyrosinase